MMRILFCLAVTCSLAACGNGADGDLSSSDSLVVQFNRAGTGLVPKTVVATDGKAIGKIVGYLQRGESTEVKCGEEAALVFYREGRAVDTVPFSYIKEGCRFFLQTEGGKMRMTKMSNEAAAFFEALEGGRPFF